MVPAHDSFVNLLIFDEIRNEKGPVLTSFLVHPFPRVGSCSRSPAVLLDLCGSNLGPSRYCGISLRFVPECRFRR